jgi:tRNA pseudouridine32 synthase/23S rRNA pseudouridine746 synthase
MMPAPAATSTTIYDLHALAAQVDLPLLYVDDHLIIVNKPFGLSTIPGNTLVKEEGTEEPSSTPLPPPPSASSTECSTANATPSSSTDPEGNKKEASAASMPPAPPQNTLSSPLPAAPPSTSTTTNPPQSQPPPIPNNNKRKRTHQELWMDMLTQDPTTLQHALNLSTDPHLAPTLASLLAHKSSVPRKRQTFLEWGVRVLKAPPQDMEALYERLHQAFEAKEGNRQDSVQTRLLRVFQQVKTVHRLDCETSGALVLARTMEAARSLSAQFREKKIGKRYVALVEGSPLWPQPKGEVCLPMRSDRETRPKQVMDPEGGKESRTLFRTVAVDIAGAKGGGEGRTRVELTPLTGRTHQLRVHMAGLGHPILGDSIYSMNDKLVKSDMMAFVKPYSTVDDRLEEEEEEEEEGPKEEGKEGEGAVVEVEERKLEMLGSRLHLHAEILSFYHPISGERLRFVAQAPF